MDNSEPEVLVIGDVMLDRYTEVDVVSATLESNALIVKQTKEYACPGGAANVAANVSGLGSEVKLFGMCGVDVAGAALADLMTLAGIDHSEVWMLDACVTTVRHRILSSHGQLLRVDVDRVHELGELIRAGSCTYGPRTAQFNGNFAELLALANYIKPPVVVVSDYGKGYCDPSVIWDGLMDAERRGCPILVDTPRNHSWGHYAMSTTTFKPNVRQAVQFLKSLYSAVSYRNKCARLFDGVAEGTEEFYAQLFTLVRDNLMSHEMLFKYLWITLGKDGAIIGGADSAPPLRLPGYQVDAVDVTGAGDTALAVMADHLATKSDYSWPSFVEGVTRANMGGALAVAHQGTYRLTRVALDAAVKRCGNGG